MSSGATLPIHFTATGDVGGANGGEIDTVVLTPAAAIATLVLRENGSAGAIILSLQAAASGGSVVLPACDLAYSGQLHATVGGAGALAMVAL